MYRRRVAVDNRKLRLDIERFPADIRVPERKPGVNIIMR
jgi:hypothetical protein